MTDKRKPVEHDPALAGSRLNLSHAVNLADVAAGEQARFYLEQAGKGQDLANLSVYSDGNSLYTLCFLDAAALDGLSTFFAHAAQQLRYCTGDPPARKTDSRARALGMLAKGERVVYRGRLIEKGPQDDFHVEIDGTGYDEMTIADVLHRVDLFTKRKVT